ncbi:hypothetical protein MACJ_003425 [Theileria orientalis]|uniref:Uncharacterized protein n=1 Tax=Theileria orientalis TaxID=68886 RepID=A0A976XIC7_THEOR|nr:hypothetical protein MACJ_003425 [Theileria orientalis]
MLLLGFNVGKLADSQIYPSLPKVSSDATEFEVDKFTMKESDITILTENRNDPRYTDENKSDAYTMESKGGYLNYIFAEGSKCNGLKCKKESLWTHYRYEPYPISIGVDTFNNLIVMIFEYDYFLFVREGNKWVKHVRNYKIRPTRSKFPSKDSF